jgi:hypothetical protein
MTSPPIATTPQKAEDVFLPIIGQLVWLVKRGYGSFLTMEFGSPFLIVREPITASPNSPPRTRKRLARRRAFIQGDWHFWVEHADWELHVEGDTVTSEDMDRARVDQCLQALDGQRLLSVNPGAALHSLVLEFDLGASLSLRPASDSDDDEDDQWSFHPRDGDIFECRVDGRLVRRRRGDGWSG